MVEETFDGNLGDSSGEFPAPRLASIYIAITRFVIYFCQCLLFLLLLGFR